MLNPNRRFAILLAHLALAAACIAPSTYAADVTVTFDQWMTPSSPPYPHDPEYAPDGSVWYAAQRANTIGRLDPATGAFKEFALPTARSGPHGLVADKNGDVWYTGNAAALIGKVNAKTGVVTEYKMPDPAARDPHTPIIDQRGTLWFTVQGGNFVGRLEPSSGKIDLAPSLTPSSRPYGIKINSAGVPFFDLFNTNKIGSIDPQTLKITEYALPEGARPRRIDIAKDDTVYYTDYARGFLGHLDPKSGKVIEYPSPGGERSRPYAIAIASDGSVWYCETGDAAKNVLVRFDPAAKSMQSFPIPGGGGTVRHMVAGGPNELWLAESGVGKIGRARFKTN